MEETIVRVPSQRHLRARIVWDSEPLPPDGDALPPTISITHDGVWIEHSVYVPNAANFIVEAIDYFRGMGRFDLIERYLRMVRGATAVESIHLERETLFIFDTPDFREHIGAGDEPMDLSGARAMWLAYKEGDVFGIAVEEVLDGDDPMDDDSTWLERDSVWGFYGHDDAVAEARRMLAEF